MAAVALAVALLWFAAVWALLITNTGNTTIAFFFGLGLLLVPLAGPTSFVVGAKL